MGGPLDSPFVTLTGQPCLGKLSRFPGWRGAIGPADPKPDEISNLRAKALAAKTIFVEPRPEFTDYLAALLGQSLANCDLRFVRVENDAEGAESLIFLPDNQFSPSSSLVPKDFSPSDREGTLSLSRSVFGYLTDLEMAFLWNLGLGTLPEGHFLEIGSYCGKSASLLSGALRARGNGLKLFCVDPWGEGVRANLPDDFRAFIGSMPVPAWSRPFEVFLYNAALRGFLDRVVPLRSLSESVIPLFDGRFSFIFVDGHHSYVSVKRDAGVAAPKLASGGIIAFHDVCDAWPEVRSFVDGEFASLPGFAPLGSRGSVTAFRKI